MAHVRKTIRDAFIAIVTGLDTTGSNVMARRLYPIEKSKLPGLNVFNGNDELEEFNSVGYPRQMRRYFDMVVAANVSGQPDAVDDALDEIAAEVETAVGADITLGGKCHDCYLVSTEFDYETGDKVYGKAEMRFRCEYVVAEDDPETLI